MSAGTSEETTGEKERAERVRQPDGHERWQKMRDMQADIKEFSGDDLSNKQTVVYFGQMGPNGTEENMENRKKHLITAVTASLKIAL